MRPLAGPLDLLDHEAPASRPLQCKLGLTTRKLLKPLPHRSSRRGHDPAAPNLTRLAVERLVRDLPSMHIQCDYDPHRDLLELRRDERHRVRTTLEPRRSHYMSSLWSPVVATGGTQWQIRSPRKPPKQAKSVAAGCHRLPEKFHGKQGVCRGLPPVAGGPLPAREEVDLRKTPSPANPKAHRT